MKMRCITNVNKKDKDKVCAAIAVSGQPVEWRDTPDERMDYYSARDKFGSIWSSEENLSAFWAAYNAIKEKDWILEEQRLLGEHRPLTEEEAQKLYNTTNPKNYRKTA